MNFNYKKLRWSIKWNRFKHKKYYEEYENFEKYLVVSKKFDLQFLYLVPKMKGIILKIDDKHLNNVELIKTIAEYYYDKEIIIEEHSKVLENKDIRDLYKLNRHIILNNVYIEKGHYRGSNEVYQCDINTYILIIEKIEFLLKICIKYFKTEEERIIFIISQITKYIKYVKYHDYRTCLANSILLGTGVCIDFSITIYKCLTELGYECEIVNGISVGNKEDLYSNVQIAKKNDHAWNQIKINNIWYNTDITWFLADNDFKWILTSDEIFKENYRHITNRQKHICKESFDREKLTYIWNNVNKYKSVLKEYDKGNKELIISEENINN